MPVLQCKVQLVVSFVITGCCSASAKTSDCVLSLQLQPAELCKAAATAITESNVLRKYSVVTDSRRQQADALLKNLQQQQGGQLKIFLGAAPGVGKTCAMLNAARERMQQGTAVMVGLVETHGRAETEALLQGFTLLPRRQLDYQGQQLSEFDLDAALATTPVWTHMNAW